MLPDLRDLNLKGWDCFTKEEGTPRDAAGAARNRMKNRDWTPCTATKILQWIMPSSFEHAPPALKAELGTTHRSNLTQRSRGQAGVDGEIRGCVVTGWMC